MKVPGHHTCTVVFESKRISEFMKGYIIFIIYKFIAWFSLVGYVDMSLCVHKSVIFGAE